MSRRAARRAPGAALAVVVILWSCLASAQSHPGGVPSAAPPAVSGPELVSELRRGGYVLYLRHAATDFGQNDEGMTSFEDCTTQRNLTDKGRQDARAIGGAIKQLGVPIGRVLASPFCRTTETARLAFGKAESSRDVLGGPARLDPAQRYTALRQILSTPPEAGTNLVVVGHGNPFRAVAGPPHLGEGEVAVVRPLGHDAFTIVARIRPADWGMLSSP